MLPAIPLNSQYKGEKHMQDAIIQKITLGHCARGIKTCSKCREMYTRKYCLLDLSPSGYAARPVIQVEIDGEKAWREYDNIKIFDTYDEAFAYARQHNITFVKETPGEPDPELEKLRKQLPAKWSMLIENDRLILKRNEPAYEQITNLINAPVMILKKDRQEKEATAKKEGKEITCTFVFQMETRWFPERLERARKTKVRLPDYVSRDHCLFLLEKRGMQDEYTLIYPEEASQEMYTLENKFRRIFETWQ